MAGVRPNLVTKSFRVDERLWEEAEELAQANERLMSEILRNALRAYVAAERRRMAKRAS